MSEGEKEKKNPDFPNWITGFRVLLGGGILVWMLYQNFSVEPVAWYFFGIPGLLLGYDPKTILEGFFKR